MTALVHYRRGRVWVADQRIHHGMCGCVLFLLGIVCNKPKFLRIGILLALHDCKDFRIWFAKELWQEIVPKTQFPLEGD